MNRDMRRKILFLFTLLVLATLPVMSQNMSDEEVIEYIKKATKDGVSQKQMATELAAKGVTRAQVERIKAKYEKDQKISNSKSAVDKNRMRTSVSISEDNFKGEAIGEDRSNKTSATSTHGLENKFGGVDELMIEEVIDDTFIRDKQKVAEGDTIEIFGRNIFKNRDLTFIPNQNIATPENYKLGPGDEIIIDIWGASQNTISSIISPDGNISIQDIGIIYLNGMTIKEATKYLRKELSRIYSGISDDSNSKLKVTLGQLRTIQINVMGEVEFPGTYSLSSLSSIFHAIYSAGGINTKGSLRNIRIARAGEDVAVVDLYEYILKGKDLSDITLRDGDLIIVPPYENLVSIKGKVKRPMYYETKQDETMQDLISYSGNFTSDAYKKHLQVTRKNGREFQICTVDDVDFSTFKLTDGDEVNVGAILDRFENRLEIKGAVYRPGVYQYGESIKTVKQLVEKADGIMGDAFLGRAVMHRVKEDLTLEIIQVDIKGILNGTIEDIPLQKNDILYIPSIHDLKDIGTVSVFGEVARPGDFPYAENTTLEDIIIQAGGLTESASTVKVDVSRRIKDRKGEEATDQTGKMFTFALKDGFVIDGESAFVLEPYDQVFVRKSPSYKAQVNVQVKGEVLYAGTYSLTQRNERLSDLIKKSGGFIPGAYIKGARLTRKINDDERVKMQKTLDLMKQNSDSLDIEKLELGDVYYVGIDLEAAMKNPGSSVDLVLREGDVLDIPEFNNTVRISGAVLYPNTVVYEEGKKTSHYVSQAGGYGTRAKKNKMYVLHMNGQASKAKKNSKKAITPGSELIVPSRGEPRINVQNAMAFATSAASLATMVATIANLTK